MVENGKDSDGIQTINFFTLNCKSGNFELSSSIRSSKLRIETKLNVLFSLRNLFTKVISELYLPHNSHTN